MRMFSRAITIFALIAGFCCASAYFSAARAAVSCTFSITNTAFGSVDVTANTVFDTTATLTVNCMGITGAGARVCVSLGIGTGGATNAANRFMKSGANTLLYSLFTDAARSTVWGSEFWAGAGAPAVQINFAGGTGTQFATQTIYGRVFAGQQTVVAGSYLSAFSGTDAEINYGTPAQVGSCTTTRTTATTTFNVTATVPTTCRIATNNLNFGTAGVLTANTDATTTLSPVCANGTPYNIGLNQGVNGGSVTTRAMKAAGPALINYSLFRDAGRTMNWGQTIGTDTPPAPARALPNPPRSMAGSRRRRRPRPALTTTRSSLPSPINRRRDSIPHRHCYQMSWPFFFISARTRVIMSVEILPCQPCIAVTTSVKKAGCVSTYFFPAGLSKKATAAFKSCSFICLT
jgi:spore coat protein U-like protein